MQLFVGNIVKEANSNAFFRKEVVTGEHSQVVLMSIPRGGEIGEETHDVDQTLVFVGGMGKAILNGDPQEVGPGYLAFVPAGTLHNFINTGEMPLTLYTIYAPPEHAPGTLHHTKEEAERAEHHP